MKCAQCQGTGYAASTQTACQTCDGSGQIAVKAVCGNCKHYERINPWSGRCEASAGGHMLSSPGRSCGFEPMRFTALIADDRPVRSCGMCEAMPEHLRCKGCNGKGVPTSRPVDPRQVDPTRDPRHGAVVELLTGLTAPGEAAKQQALERAFRALCEDRYVDRAKAHFGWTA